MHGDFTSIGSVTFSIDVVSQQVFKKVHAVQKAERGSDMVPF